jgi:hypothetical protein
MRRPGERAGGIIFDPRNISKGGWSQAIKTLPIPKWAKLQRLNSEAGGRARLTMDLGAGNWACVG